MTNEQRTQGIDPTKKRGVQIKFRNPAPGAMMTGRDIESVSVGGHDITKEVLSVELHIDSKSAMAAKLTFHVSEIVSDSFESGGVKLTARADPE